MLTSGDAQIPQDRDGLEAFVQVEPRNFQAWLRLGRVRRWQGDETGAAEAFRRASELSARPGSGRVEAPDPVFVRASALDELGLSTEATPLFVAAAAIYERRLADPEYARLAWAWHRLGWCRKRSGDEAGAHGAWTRAVLEAESTLVPGDPTSLYNLACYRALASRLEPALESLRQAVDAGFGSLELLEHDEDLESLRREPRWSELLSRVRGGR
ncbi:MAG: hypothetical protein JNM80_02470 [Phycisphaerae bacterium]|nr:hypothetical protein [Phycisphaerae bacterium]